MAEAEQTAKLDPTNYEYQYKKLRTDYIGMAAASADYIERLRIQLNRAAPRAEAFDAIQTILGLAAPKQQGYEEDLAYKLRQRAEELAQEAANVGVE